MALAEISEFIVNFFHFLNYLLKISVFIGKVLVAIIVNISSVTWNTLQAVGQFMVVFCEDYSYFIEDFKTGLSTIATFCIESFSAILDGVTSAVLSTGQAFQFVRNVIGELLSGRLLTVPIFTFEFLKRLLVLVGDGAWFLVTLPGVLFVMISRFLGEVLTIIGKISVNTGNQTLDIARRVIRFLVKDVPLHSVAGIIILCLAYLNPRLTKRIVYFCYRIMRYFCRKLLPYARGIRRKLTRTRQKISQCILDALLFFLARLTYLRRRTVHIYDTDIIHCIRFIRNFFTFTERRRNTTEQLHARQTDSRDRHSPSSQHSTRSQFAQITNSNKKSPRRTTSIGLCIICEDNDKTVVLIPCGHLCLCKQCAQQLENYDRYCPICRARILRKMDVFI